MVSVQILQNTLDSLKGITSIDMCLYGAEGKKTAATFSEPARYDSLVYDFIMSQADAQSVAGVQLFRIADNNGRPAFVLLVNGNDDNARMIGKMAVLQIQSLLVAYEERFDKDNFIKNLLLDNLLLVDIYNRAKRLSIDTSVKRCVYIVEVDSDENANIMNIVREAYPDKDHDFVTAVDEKNTILVKEVPVNYTAADLKDIADNIITVLNDAGIKGANVAYGTVVNEIKAVSKTYKEAKMALEVGKIFYKEKNVVGYSQLGIGRLIYQLPLPLCKMFIREIFEDRNPDEFDEETITTINKFFENNLNVSETSRQLYIHRNTLVYRIDKLEKATGLDIRVFDDAITFKIALMVGKYMKYMENQDY